MGSAAITGAVWTHRTTAGLRFHNGDYRGKPPSARGQNPRSTMPHMPRATWNGAVIAESDKFEIVEGNVYFPPESVKSEFLRPSQTHTTCWWKGEASYYTLEVEGERNADAAWFYPDASEKAKPIEGYVAFWRGVTVER